MESVSPAAPPSERVLPPPQSSRVRILDASVPPQPDEQGGGTTVGEEVQEEAGRYAVAATDVAPGELVLVATPSQTAFNPSLYRSALYLMAKVYADGGAEGATAATAAEKNRGGNARKKDKGPTTSGVIPAATKDLFAGNYLSAAEPATIATGGDECPCSSDYCPLEMNAVPPRTTLSTYCASCFRSIPANAYYVNCEDIKELSVELCLEEEAREEEAAAAAEAESSEKEEAPSAKTKKKLKAAKQPSVGGKKQKESSQQMIVQKLKEQRALLLEEYKYKHRMAAAAASISVNEWEEKKQDFFFSPAYAERIWRQIQIIQKGDEQREENGGANLAAVAGEKGKEGEPIVIGCPGCGVHCYCSYDCFVGGHISACAAAPEEGKAEQAKSTKRAECRVLRALFPLFMRSYYHTTQHQQAGHAHKLSSSSSSSGGAAEEVHKLQLPWAAPLLWARQTSHEQSVEAQGMWLAALVLTQRAVEGFHRGVAAHADAAAGLSRTAGETQEGETPTAATTTSASAADQNSGEEAAKTVAPGTTTTKAYASDSIQIPAEALLIKKLKAAAVVGGDMRRGAVEVLQRLPAAAVAKQRRQPHYLRLDGAVFDPCYDGDAGATADHARCDGSSPHAEDDAPGTGAPDRTASVQLVRLPSYAEDTSQLISNLSVLSKEMRKTYQTYYRRFVKLFSPTLHSVLKNILASQSPPAKPEEHNNKEDVDFVTEDLFLSICGAVQCNSFGIFTVKDEPLAACLYPEAAFFNHSCSPNLCRVVYYGYGNGRTSSSSRGGNSSRGGHRSPCQTVSFFALRPIRAGEPLTICYINVETTNTAERRMNLMMNYRFWCACLRCGGSGDPTAPQLAASHTVEKGEEEKQTDAGAAANAGRQKHFVGFRDGAFSADDMCGVCPAMGYRRPLLPLSLAYHRLRREQRQQPKGETAEDHDNNNNIHNNINIMSTSDDITVRECTICGARTSVA